MFIRYLDGVAYPTDEPCVSSVDGWCMTHSTGVGPVYCGSIPTTTTATGGDGRG